MRHSSAWAGARATREVPGTRTCLERPGCLRCRPDVIAKSEAARAPVDGRWCFLRCWRWCWSRYGGGIDLAHGSPWERSDEATFPCLWDGRVRGRMRQLADADE